MCIEYKYEYLYYSVLNISSPHLYNQFLVNGVFDEYLAIEFINNKLETNEDSSLNNYRVDYTQSCDDIDDWIRTQERHKVRPVFVQFQENQEIQLTGEGYLFILYEENDDENYIDDDYSTGPDDEVAYNDSVDN